MPAKAAIPCQPKKKLPKGYIPDHILEARKKVQFESFKRNYLNSKPSVLSRSRLSFSVGNDDAVCKYLFHSVKSERERQKKKEQEEEIAYKRRNTNQDDNADDKDDDATEGSTFTYTEFIPTEDLPAPIKFLLSTQSRDGLWHPTPQLQNLLSGSERGPEYIPYPPVQCNGQENLWITALVCIHIRREDCLLDASGMNPYHKRPYVDFLVNGNFNDCYRRAIDWFPQEQVSTTSEDMEGLSNPILFEAFHRLPPLKVYYPLDLDLVQAGLWKQCEEENIQDSGYRAFIDEKVMEETYASTKSYQDDVSTITSGGQHRNKYHHTNNNDNRDLRKKGQDNSSQLHSSSSENASYSSSSSFNDYNIKSNNDNNENNGSISFDINGKGSSILQEMKETKQRKTDRENFYTNPEYLPLPSISLDPYQGMLKATKLSRGAINQKLRDLAAKKQRKREEAKKEKWRQDMLGYEMKSIIKSKKPKKENEFIILLEGKRYSTEMDINKESSSLPPIFCPTTSESVLQAQQSLGLTKEVEDGKVAREGEDLGAMHYPQGEDLLESSKGGEEEEEKEEGVRVVQVHGNFNQTSKKYLTIPDMKDYLALEKIWNKAIPNRQELHRLENIQKHVKQKTQKEKPVFNTVSSGLDFLMTKNIPLSQLGDVRLRVGPSTLVPANCQTEVQKNSKDGNTNSSIASATRSSHATNIISPAAPLMDTVTSLSSSSSPSSSSSSSSSTVANVTSSVIVPIEENNILGNANSSKFTRRSASYYANEAIQALLKVEAYKQEIAQAINRCKKISLHARTHSEKLTAFDELSAMLGHPQPPSAGATGWKSKPVIGLQQLLCNVIEHVTKWRLTLVEDKLREKEDDHHFSQAFPSNQVYIQDQIDKNLHLPFEDNDEGKEFLKKYLEDPFYLRIRHKPFIWNGQNILLALPTMFEYISDVPEVSKFYGHDFKFSRNPFFRPFTLDEVMPSPRDTTRPTLIEGEWIEVEVESLVKGREEDIKNLEKMYKKVEEAGTWWPGMIGKSFNSKAHQQRLRKCEKILLDEEEYAKEIA